MRRVISCFYQARPKPVSGKSYLEISKSSFFYFKGPRGSRDLPVLINESGSKRYNLRQHSHIIAFKIWPYLLLPPTLFFLLFKLSGLDFFPLYFNEIREKTPFFDTLDGLGNSTESIVMLIFLLMAIYMVRYQIMRVQIEESISDLHNPTLRWWRIEARAHVVAEANKKRLRVTQITETQRLIFLSNDDYTPYFGKGLSNAEEKKKQIEFKRAYLALQGRKVPDEFTDLTIIG